MTRYLYAVTVTQPSVLGLVPYAQIVVTAARLTVWLCDGASQADAEWAEFDRHYQHATQLAAGMQVPA